MTFTAILSYTDKQRLCVVLGLALLLSACAGELQQQGPGTAAIASAHPLATAAGAEVLAQGGNAFDAAVAVSAALSVVEPAASGLGGGSFWLLHSADTGKQVFVDARETAPSAATRDMYLDEDGNPVKRASYDGPLSAGIPGHPAGLVHIAERYGRLPLEISLAPAIKLAEEGFVATPRMLLGLKFRKSAYANSPGFREVFLPEGSIPEPGDLIRQPDLANTLRALAEQGFEGFYRGDVADRLIDGVRSGGGIWIAEDLADYSVVEREPLVFNYRDVRVVSAPPPSSGGIVMAEIFNILGGYDLSGMSSVAQKHLAIEAMRRAYRDRADYLGDPAFVDMPVAKLVSPEYAEALRESIDVKRATPSAELPPVNIVPKEGADTTHLSVIDAAGNRVAVTQSINTWYGAGFIPEGTGVILNNEMDDFSSKPGTPNSFGLIHGSANEIEPGKRMLSSMSPTFLESDRGVAVVGTPGGSRIITQIALAAQIWMAGGTAEDMVSAKRFHQQYIPDAVAYEPGAFSDDEITGLEEKGHKLTESRRPFGNMNVVTWDFATNTVEAATDPRGEAEGRVY